MTLYVTIKEGALDFIVAAQKINNDYAEMRGIKPVIMDNYDTIYYGHAERYRRFDETIANFIEELDAAMKGVNYYNNDDAMTDYFDRAFYIDINIGNWEKPYIYTGA